MRTCVQCGQDFTPWKRGIRICSAECRRVRKNEQNSRRYHAVPLLIKVCDFCGDKYPAARSDQKYCDGYCRKQRNLEAHRRIIEDRRCRQCDYLFAPMDPAQRYCSPLCLGTSFWNRYRKAPPAREKAS